MFCFYYVVCLYLMIFKIIILFIRKLFKKKLWWKIDCVLRLELELELKWIRYLIDEFDLNYNFYLTFI